MTPYSFQIRDYAALIEQMTHVLRPGGILDMLEYGFRVHDEYKRIITPATHGGWFPRWLAEIHIASGRLGGTLDAAQHLKSWVEETRSYSNIVHTKFWTPLAPWLPGDDIASRTANEHAVLMREDVKVGPCSCIINN
jgi:hypothetical protein